MAALEVAGAALAHSSIALSLWLLVLLAVDAFHRRRRRRNERRLRAAHAGRVDIASHSSDTLQAHLGRS